MQIKRQNLGWPVDDSLMRVYLAEPAPDGRYPAILLYSDIYQLGRPITLLCDRLAGYGYVVAAPEIFHRLEPIGTAIEPNDLGRLRGNDDARRTAIADYDADARSLLEWLTAYDAVIPDKVGALGFCIGGHLALRAALQPEVKATVSCYPTGVHNGKLGRTIADTIDRFDEITGPVLTIFGSHDPHIPPAGREQILAAFAQAQVDHTSQLYEANHTFMRDDGYRFDPAATDTAWAEIIEFLQRVLA